MTGLLPGPAAPRPQLLLVDDEEQILELLELALGNHGFHVATASSGPEALELAQSRHFDLIILDVLMSPWDGFRTARELRRLPDCPPLVFLTGLSDPSYREQGLALGVGFLSKPFRPSQLVDLIGRSVGLKNPALA